MTATRTVEPLPPGIIGTSPSKNDMWPNQESYHNHHRLHDATAASAWVNAGPPTDEACAHDWLIVDTAFATRKTEMLYPQNWEYIPLVFEQCAICNSRQMRQLEPNEFAKDLDGNRLERTHFYVGERETLRPEGGDPIAYLQRRIASEQSQYTEPILMPEVGQRYRVWMQTGEHTVSFTATLREIDDDECTSGLDYRWDNGVSIEGDPLFMPNTYQADQEPAWWISIPNTYNAT